MTTDIYHTMPLRGVGQKPQHVMPRFDKSASDMQTFIDKRAIGQGAVDVAGHKRALSEQ
jgi:hypothetical protein